MRVHYFGWANALCGRRVKKRKRKNSHTILTVKLYCMLLRRTDNNAHYVLWWFLGAKIVNATRRLFTSHELTSARSRWFIKLGAHNREILSNDHMLLKILKLELRYVTDSSAFKQSRTCPNQITTANTVASGNRILQNVYRHCCYDQIRNNIHAYHTGARGSFFFFYNCFNLSIR